MAALPFDRDTILKAIEDWPVADQMTLAHEILERATAQSGNGPQRPSWHEMAGIAVNGAQPPTDEQVTQWLDEHRMEKYGH